MWGVAAILISCCLFIHLGLGEAIEKTLHIRFVLLRCVKCLTFWSVLGYSLLCSTLPAVACVAVAFGSSYASLWIDLLLAKLSVKYEDIYQTLGAEEQSDN